MSWPPRSAPKWHTNGRGLGREGVWWGHGGGKVGERRGPDGFEDPLQWAILAHKLRLVSIVNQQSMPQKPPFALDSKEHSRINAEAQSCQDARMFRFTLFWERSILIIKEARARRIEIIEDDEARGVV